MLKSVIVSLIFDVGTFGETSRALLGPPSHYCALSAPPSVAPENPRSHFQVVFESKSGLERGQSPSKSIATISIVFFTKNTIALNMKMKIKNLRIDMKRTVNGHEHEH